MSDEVKKNEIYSEEDVIELVKEVREEMREKKN